MVTVGLDCDGILSDFLLDTLDVIRDVTGKEIATSEIVQWDPWVQLGLTTVEIHEVKRQICQERFVANLMPHDGAAEGVEDLRQMGADVYVITSPWLGSKFWAHERYDWLRLRLGIAEDRVIHTSAKHMVDADWFFDDKPENVRAWRARNGAGGYLWDAPYKRDATDVPRVFNWDGLLALVRRSL